MAWVERSEGCHDWEAEMALKRGGYTRPGTDLCYGGGDSSGADVSENKTLQTEIEMPLEEGR